MEQINNMNYVDLGLPSGIKWATCNIGANSPEEYGDYFVWNEIETKEMQIVRNFKTVVRKFLGLSKIDKRKKIRDKAKANWRDNWRLPTNREMEELVDKCTWEWFYLNGISGMKVTGPNDNSIFLPATGLYFSVSELMSYTFSQNSFVLNVWINLLFCASAWVVAKSVTAANKAKYVNMFFIINYFKKVAAYFASLRPFMMTSSMTP